MFSNNYLWLKSDNVSVSQDLIKLFLRNKFVFFLFLLTLFSVHLGPLAFPRAVRQFGRILKYKHESLNSGIGPFLKIKTEPDHNIQEPTNTFDKNLSLVISGLN